MTTLFWAEKVFTLRASPLFRILGTRDSLGGLFRAGVGSGGRRGRLVLSSIHRGLVHYGSAGARWVVINLKYKGKWKRATKI